MHKTDAVVNKEARRGPWVLFDEFGPELLPGSLRTEKSEEILSDALGQKDTYSFSLGIKNLP